MKLQFTIRDLFGWTFLAAVACALANRPIRACCTPEFVKAVRLPIQLPMWLMGFEWRCFTPSDSTFADVAGLTIGSAILVVSMFLTILIVGSIFLAITGRYK